MKIVQATFKVFHHFELGQQLLERGYLRRLYTTWPWSRVKREGLPRAIVRTFPAFDVPNYLLRQSRFYPPYLREKLDHWNTLAFDEYTLRTLPECDVFLAMSLAGLRTGRMVQKRGGLFVSDRGSTHHRFQRNVLEEEYRRWKATGLKHEPHVTLREEEIYATADAITVPSQASRASYIAMGIPGDKVHVIPYGVRLDRFRRTQDPPTDAFEVLYAGQVSLRKGIPYLLQAFARLRHPRKRLTVVGSIEAHIRPLLADWPTDNVTFTGALPQTELIERMGRSHVLMLASIEEGLALVQAQAMACGCPVIATRATGAEDLFTDGTEGYIVENRDVDALADRLQRVADDPRLQQQLSAAATERVKAIGGWHEYGQRWDKLLHRLTGLGVHPPA